MRHPIHIAAPELPPAATSEAGGNAPSCIGRTASLSYRALVGAGVAGSLLIVSYLDSLRVLVSSWIKDENYSHGILVPLISAVLLWMLSPRLAAVPIRGTGYGLGVMGLAAGLYIVGELSAIYVLLHLSFALQLIGLYIALHGTGRARMAAFPLGYLLTAIPLPSFLYQAVTSTLQLWSSALGIGCLQLVGITAFQEGNVIDLGPVQLQVVEACSGLRYLFPLVSLSLLAAYLLHDRFWKRVLLVASSIPIAILLNGLRIGLTGVLVELTGSSAAEGFLHLFEGWLLFLLSVGVLCFEVWVLKRCGPTMPANPPRPMPPPVQAAGEVSPLAHWPAVGAVALTLCLALTSSLLSERLDAFPPRQTFLDFPQQFGEWRGQPFPLEQRYLEALRLDDYYLGDYVNDARQGVNVYVAYYRSQRKGQSAHSPKACIPAGGWDITSLTTTQLERQTGGGVVVNRVIIQKQAERQLVYYWFKQRDRSLIDEYLVKWFILWDGLIRHRTDGALIRLATPIGTGETDAVAEARLSAVAKAVLPTLTLYVPD